MKRAVYPLYAPADESRVRPILDALEQKGVTVRSGQAGPGKGDALVLFLSKNVSAEGPEAEAFFRLNADRALVIPVDLDGSAPPEELQSALMARHSLDSTKYTAGELADRIARAVKGDEKSRLPLILSVAAAVILLAVGGVVLWKNRPASPPDIQVDAGTPTPRPTATPRMPDNTDLTLEELEKVFELIIVGDSFNHYNGDEDWMRGSGNARVGVDHVANRSFENGEARWYSAEDGHQYAMCDWGDLSFLPYMKNLSLLTLVNVKGRLPDLSGLPKLNCVELLDCAIDDISGISGTSLISFGYYGPATDLSPLNVCQRLDWVNLMLYGSADIDLAAFAPPALVHLHLTGQGDERSIDLSGLKACHRLEDVELERLPVADLNFLSGTAVLGRASLIDLTRLTSLKGLESRPLLGNVFIDNCFELRDLSALSSCIGLGEFCMEDCPVADLSFLSGAKSLKTLELRNMGSLRSFHGLEDHRTLQSIRLNDLGSLTDISALASCTNLEKLHAHECYALTDISPVVTLPRLRYLMLFGAAVRNVDFLWDVVNKDNFSFGIAEVDDWSGLAAIEKYADLNITDHDGSALPYLQNATVENFEFYNRSGLSYMGDRVDLSLLPHVTHGLYLYCVRSLEGLDQPDVRLLWVYHCPFLTSLSGVEGLPQLAELEVVDCPKLNDWSALYGQRLEKIGLEALFTLPDFSRISVRDISLTTIYDLKDLSCFAGYNREFYRISLMDVDQVTDLSPLYHVKGTSLKVPAHLKDQAQALVDSGLLEKYEVVYPEGWWRPIEPHVELANLAEIDTLPAALLSRIKVLTLAGDAIVPDEEAHVEEDYGSYPPALYLCRDGEERVPVKPGTLTDLTCLEKLTGLEGLTVYAQPQLVSLEGVQGMDELKRLNINQAAALADASAAFTVQSLEELSLRFTGITSIQGVQNLFALRQLHVNDSPVTDLSPLTSLSNLEDVNFFLPMMTLETLKAQPEVVRWNVRSLTIAGEYVYDGGPWWFEADWVTDPPTLYLHSNETGERLPLEEGPVTDMGDLTALLPNLENLDLYGQPLTALDGLEGFGALRRITVEECRQLTDYSALWRVPSLEDVSLRNQPIDSIEGIENLPHLTNLSLSGANVTDFSPLARVDYSHCTSEDYFGWGFSLALDVRDPDRFTYEDYAVLEAVPVYWSLNMNNVPVDRWLGHVMGKEMHQLSCHRSGMSDQQLRSFAEAHPMLETLDLRWNPQITDLSCLLGLERLQTVFISQDMQTAVASLGDRYGFDLDIDN